jgi:hypothetical protein
MKTSVLAGLGLVGILAVAAPARAAAPSPAAGPAPFEIVPMLALGPLFEQTTGAHFAGYAGAEVSYDFRWFWGGRLYVASTPGVDAFVEGGRYFQDQLVSLSLGVGGGGAKHDDFHPLVVGSVGLFGRLVSIDLGARPSRERGEFLAIMLDVPHGLMWLASCGMPRESCR